MAGAKPPQSTRAAAKLVQAWVRQALVSWRISQPLFC